LKNMDLEAEIHVFFVFSCGKLLLEAGMIGNVCERALYTFLLKIKMFFIDRSVINGAQEGYIKTVAN